MDEELKNLRETISLLPDDELIKMVSFESADYRKEAIAFAQEEIKKRNLVVDSDTIHAVRKSMREEKYGLSKGKSDEKIKPILTFLFWAVIIYFAYKAYHSSAKQVPTEVSSRISMNTLDKEYFHAEHFALLSAKYDIKLEILRHLLLDLEEYETAYSETYLLSHNKRHKISGYETYYDNLFQEMATRYKLPVKTLSALIIDYKLLKLELGTES